MNRIPILRLREMLGGCALPDGLYDAGKVKVDPQIPGRFEFWGEQAKFKQVEFSINSIVRLKTIDYTIFIETVAVKAGVGKTTTYAGENVLESWTDKINNNQNRAIINNNSGSSNSTSLNNNNNNNNKEVEDSEWN
eukprot:TRINITY_DN402_c1_g2_i1.p1 TRINITY_DN402_c1_g2~~TRINITY_DN402_c1_g2_i1.p1  ORF type:complete len:136 (-),score=67.05 TRINITY_DN402_c1_g2_i1:146-553(-)